MKSRVYSGLDKLETAAPLLRGRRVGLMTNPTGIDRNLRSAVDILRERYTLSALFACEHGLRGNAQAGAEIETDVDKETGVTVYSVYTKSHRLTAEMLDAFDVLVFDMQDVGVRFYTYLYSLSYAMEACAEAGKPIVVLDRLNPLGGEVLWGTVLDTRFSSFVGNYALPSRYALTIGEYARYAKAYLGLDLDLTVVPLEGWKRHMYLDDTDTPWVAPSPNCPSLQAALCYAGTCVFEGTSLSEGRGTTQPFELIGAPWLDGAALEKTMNAYGLPGLHFRRTSFAPVFSKHAGVLCHGVQVHVTDRARMDAFAGAMLLMDAARAQNPELFQFECWNGKYALDRLLGTDDYRQGRMDARALIDAHAPKVKAFAEKSKAYYLYD